MKILFILTVLIIITYKIVIAMNTERISSGVMKNIKENLSGGLRVSIEETGYTGMSITPINFLIKDNSCSMLH